MPLATAPPSSRPSTAVTISQQVAKPRRPGPAYSEMKLVMVPISPPAEKPCTQRISTRITGAAMPMLA
ncbi:hypothetical protein D3C78_487980 [compost metagenome]